MQTDVERSARLEIVAAGAVLNAQGVILPGEGNLSMRVAGDVIVVTPAGCDKGRLETRWLIRLQVKDAVLPNKASSELRIHQEVYRGCPDVKAVVHAHPPQVQTLAATGQLPDCSLLMEAETVLGNICRVGGHAPGSQELASAVVRGVEGSSVCVMERHGAITTASTMGLAVLRMLLLERLAALTLASFHR